MLCVLLPFLIPWLISFNERLPREDVQAEKVFVFRDGRPLSTLPPEKEGAMRNIQVRCTFVFGFKLFFRVSAYRLAHTSFRSGSSGRHS